VVDRRLTIMTFSSIDGKETVLNTTTEENTLPFLMIADKHIRHLFL
jgi:hypothetical protein